MLMIFVLISWHYYLVDPYGGASDIAFDNSGNPHLFYYSADLGQVLHAWWDGANFEKEVIATGLQYYNGGPAAVFDDQNRIHLAYFTSDEHLGYGFYDGTWHFEVADTTTKTGNFVNIALDQNNQPHITHRHSLNIFYGYLRYTKKVSGGWETYEFSSDYGGYHTSIAIDVQGYPHIADCTDGSDLQYIFWDGQSWQIEKPALDYASTYSSMVLDNQGRPQISYYWALEDSNTFELRFTNKNSGAWQIYTVDHGELPFKRGWDNDIAIDDDGMIHITYHAHNKCLVKYAYGSGDNWYISVVDTVGGWYSFNAIGLNGNDVFMSYCDGDGLWLATTRELPGIVEQNNKGSDVPYRSSVGRFIKAKGKFSIYDIAGRLILSGDYSQEKRVLFKSGIYFLKGENYLKKFVLVR